MKYFDRILDTVLPKQYKWLGDCEIKIYFVSNLFFIRGSPNVVNFVCSWKTLIEAADGIWKENYNTKNVLCFSQTIIAVITVSAICSYWNKDMQWRISWDRLSSLGRRPLLLEILDPSLTCIIILKMRENAKEERKNNPERPWRGENCS